MSSVNMSPQQMLKMVKMALAHDVDRCNEPYSGPRFQLEAIASQTWIRQHRTWHPKGYYDMFCAHDKARFLPCQQCRRNTKEASQFLATMIAGVHTRKT